MSFSQKWLFQLTKWLRKLYSGFLIHPCQYQEVTTHRTLVKWEKHNGILVTNRVAAAAAASASASASVCCIHSCGVHIPTASIYIHCQSERVEITMKKDYILLHKAFILRNSDVYIWTCELLIEASPHTVYHVLLLLLLLHIYPSVDTFD